ALLTPRTPSTTLFPYTALFRSSLHLLGQDRPRRVRDVSVAATQFLEPATRARKPDGDACGTALLKLKLLGYRLGDGKHRARAIHLDDRRFARVDPTVGAAPASGEPGSHEQQRKGSGCDCWTLHESLDWFGCKRRREVCDRCALLSRQARGGISNSEWTRHTVSHLHSL